MSNESPTWFEHLIRQKRGVIEKGNLEALARLTMLRRFEITHVDGLVLAVVDLPWPESGLFIKYTRLPSTAAVEQRAKRTKILGKTSLEGLGTLRRWICRRDKGIGNTKIQFTRRCALYCLKRAIVCYQHRFCSI